MRKRTGYLFRRTGGKHYNIDDRAHADAPIYLCYMVCGDRKTLAMRTGDKRLAEIKASKVMGGIAFGKHEQYLAHMIELGELARREFGAELIDQGPWMRLKNPHTRREIVVKDVIADNFLQQILLRPQEYSVIATLNLNGDYISDALAAQVGGIGIAPGANLSDTIAMFEATHGTAPKYAGKDMVNPGSLILSAEMMVRHLGWTEAADLIIRGMEGAIAAKTVTYDFARLMDDAHQLSCSGFGTAVIRHMEDDPKTGK